MNNDIRELSIDELDAVTGGGGIMQGVATTFGVLRTALALGEAAAVVMAAVAFGGGKK